MKRSHYVFALIILAGTTLYAQRGSEQQGSVRALGGSSSPRASAGFFIPIGPTIAFQASWPSITDSPSGDPSMKIRPPLIK